MQGRASGGEEWGGGVEGRRERQGKNRTARGRNERASMGVSRSRDDYRLGGPVIQDITSSFCPTSFLLAFLLSSSEARAEVSEVRRSATLASRGKGTTSAFGSSYLIAELTGGSLSLSLSLPCARAAIDPSSRAIIATGERKT